MALLEIENLKVYYFTFFRILLLIYVRPDWYDVPRIHARMHLRSKANESREHLN